MTKAHIAFSLFYTFYLICTIFTILCMDGVHASFDNEVNDILALALITQYIVSIYVLVPKNYSYLQE